LRPHRVHSSENFLSDKRKTFYSHPLESRDNVIHRILVDNEPFRTATNDLGLRNVDGVRIGTAASWFSKG